jgi:hypothetical protein
MKPRPRVALAPIKFVETGPKTYVGRSPCQQQKKTTLPDMRQASWIAQRGGDTPKPTCMIRNI